MTRTYETQAGGSFGPANHGLSIADGYAFFRCEGVDLSGYAGVEYAATPYILRLTDSAGKEAVGFIGAADAAESLASELLSNTGFETAGAGDPDFFGTWTESASDGAIADETGTYHDGSHSCKLTAGASLDTGVWQAGSVTDGRLCKLTLWTRGDGTNAGRFYVKDQDNGTGIIEVTSTEVTGTDWTQKTYYFTAPSGCSTVRVWLYCPASNGAAAYFDDISLKMVDDVGTDGVHIIETVNGSTRNWTSEETGFDRNDSAYTFQVEKDFIGDEALYWQDGDGTEHLLGQAENDEDSFYTEWSDMDFPPIDWQSQAMPDYHGEKHRGFRYQPRTMNVGLFRYPGNTINALLDDKETLFDWFNHDLGIGKIRKVWLSGSSVWKARLIECYLAGPMGMDSDTRRAKGTGGQYAILPFWCPYPIWYDPVRKSGNVSLDGATPVTLAVTNGGMIDSFPEINIAANADSPQIQIQGDAVNYISLDYDISTGSVTIYCERGNKRILTSSDTDITWKASAESVFFALPRGSTTLEMSCDSGTGTVTVYWYDWYTACP